MANFTRKTPLTEREQRAALRSDWFTHNLGPAIRYERPVTLARFSWDVTPESVDGDGGGAAPPPDKAAEYRRIRDDAGL